MRKSCLLLIGLVSGLAFASDALAKPAYGTMIDQRCTQLGWVPAKPYNPNGVISTDPSKVNCALCHTGSSPSKSNVNASGKLWFNSGKTDVSPFCHPPTTTNHPPAFAAVGAKSATVGQQLQFTVTATDPDNDAIALTVSNSPTGATFTDAGNGTGTFRWTPTATQTGSRVVTFHANDAGSPMASATLDVTITVGAANRPPVLAAIGNKQVNVGAQLSITFSATDPDGNALAYSLTGKPSGAVLSGAMLTWTPTASQVGNYPVTVTVTDNGTPALSDSEAITITVGSVNQPPVLAPIGDRTVDLGTTGRIALTSSDPDMNVITLACAGLPSDATFTDVGDGTGEIVWMPTAVGSYSVTCSATDNGMPAQMAQETFMLASRDPGTLANAPTVTLAEWVDASGKGGLLNVTGDAPEAASARGDGRRVDLFAVVGGVSPVKVGEARADANGHFTAKLAPFVAPCQVAAAANGQMGTAAAVTDAPADCDATPLLQVRARSSCDGFTLKTKGRRAPPNATITGTDVDTANDVFTVQTTKTTFRAKAQTPSFVHTLLVGVDAGGETWTTLVPVSPCH
jgi:hypothetical protein